MVVLRGVYPLGGSDTVSILCVTDSSGHSVPVRVEVYTGVENLIFLLFQFTFSSQNHLNGVSNTNSKIPTI